MSACYVGLVCECMRLYVSVGNVLCKGEVAQRGVWACLLLGLGMFLECRPWNSTPEVKICIFNLTLSHFLKPTHSYILYILMTRGVKITFVI